MLTSQKEFCGHWSDKELRVNLEYYQRQLNDFKAAVAKLETMISYITTEQKFRAENPGNLDILIKAIPENWALWEIQRLGPQNYRARLQRQIDGMLLMAEGDSPSEALAAVLNDVKDWKDNQMKGDYDDVTEAEWAQYERGNRGT